MNILHVIDSLSPAKGGPSVSCPSLAATQAFIGHSVTVVYYGNPSEEIEIQRIGNETISHFSKLNRVNLGQNSSRMELLFAKKLLQYLKSTEYKWDFVHIHGIWLPNLLIAAYWCYQKGIRYAIAPRGMLDYWSMAQSRFKKHFVLSVFWKKALNRAHFIHALNENEKSTLLRYKLKAPIVISPNGVSVSKINELELIDQHQGSGRYILFISRLHIKKGLDFLAKAFALVLSKYPDVRLKVVGPDEGALGSFLEEIKKLDIDSNIDILGPIYGNEKYRLIKGAVAFCLPSRQEGFSVMLAEVLACKTPVIISKQCNFPEVAHYHAGIVVDLNPRSISEAMSSYFADSHLTKYHGKNGGKLIRDLFTWESITKSLLKHY